MKVYVRTTGERTIPNIPYQYEILLDKEYKGIFAYFEQLHYLSQIDDDILLLEDDVIFKDNFDKVLKETIKNNPNTIINCHTWYCDKRGKGIQKSEGHFVGLQAVYYPKDKLKEILKDFNKLEFKYIDEWDWIQAKLDFEFYAIPEKEICEHINNRRNSIILRERFKYIKNRERKINECI